MTDDQATPLGAATPGPPRYAVRAATVEDAKEIAQVHIVSWRAAYRGLLPQSLLDGLSVERRTAQWRQSIPSGALDIQVAATPDGRVGGFIATGPSRDGGAGESVGELMSIYLRPELWSLGIGGRLHAVGIAGMTRRFELATLWVLASNARSRAFYERHGWRPDGTAKRATIGDVDVDEVRYRRPLNGHIEDL
jgi:RimJ/RimL family protein N-acetyltransferase